MPDYNAILDTQVDPDAPLTSQLGYQFRDNPIAIAEGAAGAPRVTARSRAFEFIGAIDGSGTTAVGFNNLDVLSLINLQILATNQTDPPGSRNLEIRASSDNGASYGSFFAVAQVGTTTIRHRVTVLGYLNCVTGVFTFSRLNNELTSVDATALSLGVTNVNAFQIRGSGTPMLYTMVANAVSRGSAT